MHTHDSLAAPVAEEPVTQATEASGAHTRFAGHRSGQRAFWDMATICRWASAGPQQVLASQVNRARQTTMDQDSEDGEEELRWWSRWSCYTSDEAAAGRRVQLQD